MKKSPKTIAQDFLVQKNLLKPARNGKKGIIRLGSKIFAEQYILVQLYTLLISGYTDLQVETKTGLGGTKICFDALTNNQIDLYPEYTGTGLLVILKPNNKILNEVMRSKEKAYDYVKDKFQKQYHLTWLTPIGFNNAYALMMRRQQAQALHIKTISDLQQYLDAEKSE